MLSIRHLNKLNDLTFRFSYSRLYEKYASTGSFAVAEDNALKKRKPEWISFNHATRGTFFQANPKLKNPFLADIPLQRFLNRVLPEEVNKEIYEDLTRFGERIVDEIDDLGKECEEQLPFLNTYDAWGKRVDDVKTCSAWKQQHSISAEEGLVGIGYERKLNEWSRLHQMCKLYLYAPSSGLYSCPLAMTDGCAKTIEAIGFDNARFQKAFENLTSRDPAKFWTAGQWMTERKGGSDVANGTETVAIPENGFYRLYGYKWFTSAVDANVALTLAQEFDNADDLQENKRLTLFYLEPRNEMGSMNNIQIMRLKDKLGTRSLPTAELLLDGSVAYKMSKKGHGISAIANMLNITRLHNAISAVAQMRRILLLARDYAQHRIAFGKPILQHPLHMQVLSRMEVEIRGSLILLFKAVILLGKIEVNSATSDDISLLRLILPLLKLYSAKQAVSIISEGLEAFGGQGYMEDTGLPVMLRNAQVLPIWEGTTNIMALDVLRSFSTSNLDALKSLERSVCLCLESAKQNIGWMNYCAKVDNSLQYIINFVQDFPQLLKVASRDLSYSLARTYIGALLIENACVTRSTTEILTAQRWCDFQDLCPLKSYHNKSSYEEEVHNDMKLVTEEAEL